MYLRCMFIILFSKFIIILLLYAAHYYICSGKFVYIGHHFILLRLNPFDLSVMVTDGGLSTLCHSCGFACQQKLLKTFPGPGYLHLGLESPLWWIIFLKQNFYLKAHNHLHKILVQIFVAHAKIVRGTSSEPWKTPHVISFYMTHIFPYAFQLPPMFLIWKLSHYARFYQKILKYLQVVLVSLRRVTKSANHSLKDRRPFNKVFYYLWRNGFKINQKKPIQMFN